MEQQSVQSVIAYVLGPLGALALALVWIRFLLKEVVDLRQQLSSERSTSTARNDELSSLLLQHIESASRERSKLQETQLLTHDSSVRNILNSLERALSKRPTA